MSNFQYGKPFQSIVGMWVQCSSCKCICVIDPEKSGKISTQKNKTTTKKEEEEERMRNGYKNWCTRIRKNETKWERKSCDKKKREVETRIPKNRRRKQAIIKCVKWIREKGDIERVFPLWNEKKGTKMKSPPTKMFIIELNYSTKTLTQL